ncbi:hypothetical protein [Nonomuraea sp. GTA35]|uniref:hypothetical protein n=1 Tax=Nonomuraea sp. GTA35 TaxID=1676746 RepID=UPI0035BFFA8D
MPFTLHRLLVMRWPTKKAAERTPAKAPEAGQEPDVTPEEASYVFAAPSEGDGYLFTVKVWLWRRSATGSLVFRPWKELKEDKDHVIKDYVREIVRGSLRRHSVFRAEQAERAANAAVQRWLANLPADSVSGRWRAVIEVEVPDAVRELRCAHESALYRIETRAEQLDVRMRKLRESRDLCESFLKEAMEDSTIRHAVRLTQAPADVADITDQMLAERKEKADNLLELFTKIVDAQRHANAFELVLASESALRAAFERLDVPLPPPDPDSPFALTEEAG